MDHEMAVRQRMTERYLLDELDPKARDEFEEHYFECQECALDVKTGTLFVEKSKNVLAEGSSAVTPLQTRMPSPSQIRETPWLAWLRPALTIPAMALLLAVIGYQSLVSLPRAHRALTGPQVFQSWAAVNVGTWGEGGPTIITKAGGSFLLFVRIPPDSSYASYTVEMLNPAGKLEWSFKLPASANQNPSPVEVPGTDRAAGSYKLAVHGITAAGESKDLGGAQFELQIQQ